MPKVFSFRRTTLFWGFLSWLLPLVVSFFFVNPDTKQYTINFWLFKFLMAAILAAVTFFGYKKISLQNPLEFTTPNTFLLINIVGDLVVLLILFQYPLFSWLTTILPIYLVVIYGVLFLQKNQKS